MIRKIIKYKNFKTSEEFEAWQTEGEEKVILSTIPQITTIDIDIDEKSSGSSESKGEVVHSVFVTYVEEVEITEK